MTNETEFQALQDIMQPADLHPDLQEYLYTTKSGFPFLNHPLVQNIMHTNEMNNMMNRSYAQKQKRLQRAIEEKDYTTVVFLHERPFRLEAFMKYVYPYVKDKTYWEILSSIWTDTMNSWQNHDVWEMLWNSNIPGREFVMEDEEDREKYNSLTDKIIAYRGVGNEKNIHGFSWSLDIKIAQKFSRMYNQNGSVYRAVIDKKNVFAYFSCRNEDEIVVRPKSFRIKKIE